MSRRYEVVEHTADVGVHAEGSTLAELFAAAAEGMYAVMVEDLDTVEEREQRTVEVSGSDRVVLLESWLLELLFLTQTEGLLFRRFDVEIEGGTVLRARAWGEPLDPARHALGPEVKAVTRYDLAIEETGEGYSARVVLDI